MSVGGALVPAEHPAKGAHDVGVSFSLAVDEGLDATPAARCAQGFEGVSGAFDFGEGHVTLRH